MSGESRVRAEVVSVETETLPLDGLLYEPEHPRGAVLLMHGNTMNFYVGPPRFLPPFLLAAGFSCLAYNRRGHDVLSNRSGRVLEGGAYQTIAEAVADNEHAGRWLRERGYPAPIVVGHSNGGMLGVRYTADHPDTPALVLLSAHRGGRRILQLMADAGLMAADRYEEVTARAQDLVAAGRGDELLIVPGWWYVISAGTYVEYLERCPDVIELAPRIRCPALFLLGDEEPESTYPATEFAAAAAGPVDVQVVPDCGHYYSGRESEVAERVVGWLDRTLPPSA